MMPKNISGKKNKKISPSPSFEKRRIKTDSLEKKRIKNTFNEKGSIMMQVLVSLFILSLGLAGALAVIIAAMESNQTNQKRMIATNLAQEGLEAVRSIRDTNWLTYSSNLRECWNFWEDTDENGVIDTSDTDCSPNGFGQNDHPWTTSSEGDSPNFIVDFDPSNFRWKIIPDTKFDNIVTDPNYEDGYQLFTKEINGKTFFTHNKSGSTDTSVFSRKIEMYYIDETNFDDSTDPITPGAFPVSSGAPPTTETGQDNRILVISTVSWNQKGRDHTVVMNTIMTDFLDRHEWNS